jgi:hypothetical protein
MFGNNRYTTTATQARSGLIFATKLKILLAIPSPMREAAKI